MSATIYRLVGPEPQLIIAVADVMTDLPTGYQDGSLGYTKDSGLLYIYENGHWESKAGFERNLRRLLELILVEQHAIRALLERGA